MRKGSVSDWRDLLSAEDGSRGRWGVQDYPCPASEGLHAAHTGGSDYGVSLTVLVRLLAGPALTLTLLRRLEMVPFLHSACSYLRKLLTMFCYGVGSTE